MPYRILLTIWFFAVTALPAAAENVRPEPSGFDRQMAERAAQYQKTLRQRIAQVAPSLQQKTELQIRQTLKKDTALFKAGKLHLSVALPKWKAYQESVRFVAKHSPFSGLPDSAFCFGFGMNAALLTVSAGQYHVKNHAANIAGDVVKNVHSVCPVHFSGGLLSYFVRIVRSVVLRN
ncbi:MAG: hypothetical protein LBH00_06155 [Planctomycetaceae bacterium]|jgi:hypothetical protein|nr:hypothetical protein [Planctomycetaceae bacterium]